MRKESIRKIILTGAVLLVVALGASAVLWTRTYKARLLAYVRTLATENLNGKLAVEDVRLTPFTNGPGLTFSFINVSVSDSRIAEHHTPLLRAKRVSASLDLGQLLRGTIRIRTVGVENGFLTVFVRHDGYSNASIFDKPAGEQVPGAPEKEKNDFLRTLETLTLRDCPVRYTDSLRGKSYAADFREVAGQLRLAEPVRRLKLDGAVFFNGLVFNAAKGGFLRNQEARIHLDLDYSVPGRQWRVHPSSIRVADPKVDQINWEGLIRTDGKPGSVALDFSVRKTSLAATLRLLPEKLEQAIVRRKILPTTAATVQVRGTLGDPTPRINVRFQTDTFSYPLPYGQLRGMKAVGTFTNQYDEKKSASDENSRIEVQRTTGFFETIPLRGHLSVTNLKVADSEMDFTLLATPATLNALLDTSHYVVRKGRAVLTFHYEGSPIKFYDAKTDRMTGTLRGKMTMRDMALTNIPGKIAISRLSGVATFDENSVLLPGLALHDGRNELVLSGKVLYLPAALFGSPNPAQAYVHARIPNWNVTWPDRLAGRRARTPSHATKFKLTKLLDETIDRLQVTASLEVDTMRYHRLEARRVRGRVVMKNQLIELQNLSMNTCGGSVSLLGGFRTFDGKGLPLFYARGKVDKANVESVFRSLGNFGQKTITDQNLRGTLTADFRFESLISNDTSFVKPSMKGFVDVYLDKVRIINFKPMLDIRRLIFKNRAWDNVRFAPLRTRLILKGEEVKVIRMKVETNVFYFFLDGTYSFGDKTNLSIQIPMNNLRRKAPANQLEIREVEDVKGDVIFLRAVHEGDDVRIRYDNVKRFR